MLAGAALGLFSWDLSNPASLDKVNTAGVKIFEPALSEKERERKYKGWNRAVARASHWRQDDEEELGDGEDGGKLGS